MADELQKQHLTREAKSEEDNAHRRLFVQPGLRLGLVGFEPTASASRTQRSTKLSHSPSFSGAKAFACAAPYLAHFRGDGKRFNQSHFQKIH
jgi:hypothetical protein